MKVKRCSLLDDLKCMHTGYDLDTILIVLPCVRFAFGMVFSLKEALYAFLQKMGHLAPSPGFSSAIAVPSAKAGAPSVCLPRSATSAQCQAGSLGAHPLFQILSLRLPTMRRGAQLHFRGSIILSQSSFIFFLNYHLSYLFVSMNKLIIRIIPIVLIYFY